MAPVMLLNAPHASSIHILSTCNVPDSQDTRVVSPDIANAPHRRHTRHRHPTVSPPARRAATSSDKKPADNHAQLAEKELIALMLKGWLQPQPAQGPAARRQRPLLWSSQSGALRGGSARPSCARWARRKLSGQPLGATGCGARAGSVTRAPYTKSILEACGSAISALVRKGLSPSNSRAGHRVSAGENEGRGRQGRLAKDGQVAEGRVGERC